MDFAKREQKIKMTVYGGRVVDANASLKRVDILQRDDLLTTYFIELHDDRPNTKHFLSSR